MAIKKRSLRGAINRNCKSCIFDPKAAGTWLAQVTLCSVKTCELYEVRPTTDSIPDSVYRYYGLRPKQAVSTPPAPREGPSPALAVDSRPHLGDENQ